MASGKGAGGGLRHLNVWALDDNNMPLVASALAAAETGERLNLAKAFTPNFPDGQIIQFTGDDKPQGQLNLSPTEMSSIELRTGMGNLPVDALLTGVKVVDLAGGKVIGRETDKDGCLADVLLLAYQQGIDKDDEAATFGATIWHYFLVPLAQVRPYSGAMEEGNAGESRYTATPQKVNQWPWALAFATVTEGFTEASVLEGYLDGPPVLDGWLGNGTLTEFEFSQTPLDTDTPKMKVVHWVAATGEATDVTGTVTLSATSITFVAAPAEDDLIYAFYPSTEGC
ncbi:MAG TPA: hypothetical protein ENO16_01410 [Chromatiales bacterium]|nr:hypothetical protein [Chromatiales bacterium]